MVEKWYARRTDLYHVSPQEIVIVEGWNDRINMALDDILPSIRENGVQEPLRVRRNKDGILELRNGERRLRAVQQLLMEGVEILTVPVLLEKNQSDAEALIGSYLANTGKPFEPLEEAHCFRRFLAWGWTIEQLAKRIGKSIGMVRNALALLDAAPEVMVAFQNGTISKSEAISVVRQARQTDEDQNAVMAERQTIKKERKSAKGTRGNIPESVEHLTLQAQHLCAIMGPTEVINAVILYLRTQDTDEEYLTALLSAQDIAAH